MYASSTTLAEKLQCSIGPISIIKKELCLHYVKGHKKLASSQHSLLHSAFSMYVHTILSYTALQAYSMLWKNIIGLILLIGVFAH